jgi:hypothetical protein
MEMYYYINELEMESRLACASREVAPVFAFLRFLFP